MTASARQSFVDQVTNTIRNGDIKAAIEQVGIYLDGVNAEDNEDIIKDHILLQARFNQLEKKRLEGTIGADDYGTRLTQLIPTLLDIIDRLPEPFVAIAPSIEEALKKLASK